MEAPGSEPQTFKPSPEDERRKRYHDFCKSPQMVRAQAAIKTCKALGLAHQGPELQVQQILGDWESETMAEVRERGGARVSFCTISYGRGWQLRPSLAINLLMCRKDVGYSCRFVVVLFYLPKESTNFTPTKRKQLWQDHAETVRWIKEHCNEDLANGNLVVYQCPASSFHSSKMKNQAHRSAIMTPWHEGLCTPSQQDYADGFCSEGWNLGDQLSPTRRLVPETLARTYGGRTPASYDPINQIANNRAHLLVNLDADNLLPDGYWRHLMKSLTTKHQVNLTDHSRWVFRSGYNEDGGCTGRVGLPELTYLLVGGYDERFEPTGYQDIDLYERVRVIGDAIYLRQDCPGGCSIPNDRNPKEARMGAKTANVAAEETTKKWSQQNELNRQMSKAKLNQRPPVWWRNSNLPGEKYPMEVEELWSLLCGLGGPPLLPMRLAARTQPPPPPPPPPPRADGLNLAPDPKAVEDIHPVDPPSLPASSAASSEPTSKKVKAPPASLTPKQREQAGLTSTPPPAMPAAPPPATPVAQPPAGGPPPPPKADGSNLAAGSGDGKILPLQAKQPPPSASKAEPDAGDRSKSGTSKVLVHKTPPGYSPAPKHAAQGRGETPVPGFQPPPKNMPRAPLRLDAVPTCSLRIVTCGLFDLATACKFVAGKGCLPNPIWQACKRLAHRGKKHDPLSEEEESLLLDVLTYCDVLGVGKHSCIVEDMRKADDPDHDKRLRSHIGSYPKTMLGVANATHCKNTLKRIRRALWAKFAQDKYRGNPFVTVVVFCKKGIHRSVATGKLLQMVTAAYSKGEAAASSMPIDILVKDLETVHVGEMNGQWESKCGNCLTCRHVDLDRHQEGYYGEALQVAMKAWRAA